MASAKGMCIKSKSLVMTQLFSIPKIFSTIQGRCTFSYRTDVVEITFTPEHRIGSVYEDYLLAPGAVFTFLSTTEVMVLNKTSRRSPSSSSW